MMDKKPHIKPYLYGMLAGFGAISLSIIFFFFIYRFEGFGDGVSKLTSILMPFIWTFSFSSFISAYCAYPIIKRYMIDPHYGEDGGEAEEAEETERVFTDRG